MLPIHTTDSSKLNEAQRDLAKQRDAVHALERRSEKQSAILRALCELLCEKTGMADTELLARVIRIESARRDEPIADCPKCDRPLKSKSRKCLYCGSELPVTTVFDLI